MSFWIRNLSCRSYNIFEISDLHFNIQIVFVNLSVVPEWLLKPLSYKVIMLCFHRVVPLLWYVDVYFTSGMQFKASFGQIVLALSVLMADSVTWLLLFLSRVFLVG